MTKSIAGIFILGSLIWASKYYDLASYASLEIIKEMAAATGPYGTLAFVSLCVTAVLLHMPEILLKAAGSVVFRGIKGLVPGCIGCVIGMKISFAIVNQSMP